MPPQFEKTSTIYATIAGVALSVLIAIFGAASAWGTTAEKVRRLELEEVNTRQELRLMNEKLDTILIQLGTREAR